MVDHQAGEQLSFMVHAHPAAREGWLDATLAVGGAFTVTRDLQPGAELTVSIAGADGEILASGTAAVLSVGFVPITNDGDIVGTTRVHKAKLT